MLSVFLGGYGLVLEYRGHKNFDEWGRWGNMIHKQGLGLYYIFLSFCLVGQVGSTSLFQIIA